MVPYLYDVQKHVLSNTAKWQGLTKEDNAQLIKHKLCGIGKLYSDTECHSHKCTYLIECVDYSIPSKYFT